MVIKFQHPRVSPGDQPLAKEPEDSGYEIDSHYIREYYIHASHTHFVSGALLLPMHISSISNLGSHLYTVTS